MKLKFTLLTFLLLFARGCDFYSTSLWFFKNNGINDERNPLTYFFGIGWTGLIIVNILVIGTILSLLYYFYFNYKRQTDFIFKARNYKELASLQYFNKPDSFYKIFYKMPKNKNIIFAQIGYVGTIVTIIASFLATFHNISQFYGFWFYNYYRQIVGRPLFIIYALIMITAVLAYRSLLKSEYKKYVNIG